MRTLAVLAVLLLSTQAQAYLISLDDKTWGEDSITLDKGTGLEWLDVNIGAGLSYNDMLKETSAGGKFDGWRYASFFEVRDLFSTAGIPCLGQTPPEPDGRCGRTGLFVRDEFAKLTVEFVEMTGVTSVDEFGEIFQIAVMDDFYGLGQQDLGLRDTSVINIFPGPIARIDHGESGSPLDRPSEGHWLVRDASSPIPEPSAALLFGVGLLVVRLRYRAES